LLGLALRQVEQLELRFGLLSRLRGAGARPVENDFRSRSRLERRVGVDRAGDLEQGGATAGCLLVEETVDAVEAAGRDPGERGGLFGGEPGRAPLDLPPDRALGQAPEWDQLAAGADRLGQRPQLVGDEDDHRVGRRLLEVLE
jgi:hypothetical protein